MARETTTELEVAKDKHETDMTKLLHQKEALVERAKEHRKVHKVAMAGAAEKQDALSILCSAVECANQKLVRVMIFTRSSGMWEHYCRITEKCYLSWRTIFVHGQK